MAKKIHLCTTKGGRSVCRYSSRPSRQVRMLPLADFVRQSKESQCSECAAVAATFHPTKDE